MAVILPRSNHCTSPVSEGILSGFFHDGDKVLGIISELQTSKIVFIGTKKSYLLLFHSNRLKKKIEVRKKKERSVLFELVSTDTSYKISNFPAKK